MQIKAALLVVFAMAPLSIRAAALDSGDAPYERCALCHGLYGDSARAKFPKLAGQKAAYLEQQILNFRDGIRNNDGGQMTSMVTELDGQDLTAVVAWFSSQADPRPGAVGDPNGETLFRNSGCGQCHDESDRSGATPLLAAQHQPYLAKQMRDFRDGDRPAGADVRKLGQLSSLSDTDIDGIAAYLAALPRVEVAK